MTSRTGLGGVCAGNKTPRPNIPVLPLHQLQAAGISSARSSRSADIALEKTCAPSLPGVTTGRGRPPSRIATAGIGNGPILAAADGLADAILSATSMLKERQQRGAKTRRANSLDRSRGGSPLAVAGAAATHARTNPRRERARSSDVCASTASSAASAVPLTSARAPPRPRLGKPSVARIENPGLKRIADQCAELTSQMNRKGVREAKTGNLVSFASCQLCSLWANSFVCGTLQTRSSAKVICFEDRLEYTIHGHPQEDTVRMVMEFQHFVKPLLRSPSRTFQFRLEKELQYFSRHYSPQNLNHVIAINFTSAEDFDTFEKTVWPSIQRTCKKLA